MKIEIGKRYRRRDGSITTPIVYSLYPFECSRGAYQEDGSYNEGGSCSDWDLVEEYAESVPVEAWDVKSNVSGKLICCGDTKPYYELEFKGHDVKIVKLREVTSAE